MRRLQIAIGERSNNLKVSKKQLAFCSNHACGNQTFMPSLVCPLFEECCGVFLVSQELMQVKKLLLQIQH